MVRAAARLALMGVLACAGCAGSGLRNELFERQAIAHELVGDREDEAQVRGDQPVRGLGVAALGAPDERAFLLRADRLRHCVGTEQDGHAAT